MIANRVVIIDNGKIKAADTPQNLISEMRTAGRIQCELQAPKDITTPILSELPNVKKVSSEDLEDGWISYTVWSDSGTDTRQSISAISALNNWPLRSIFRYKATLEDVFVEMTRRD